MPVSQNGYSANDRSLIRRALILGTDIPVWVRMGAAGDLLLYVAQRWNHEVEPLRAADGVLDCWGFAPRLIRGSTTTLSNHASGTALDFRARAHPLGESGTYTDAQVAAIQRILADCRGAVRWGGAYSHRKDEMHVEVIVDQDRCQAVLTSLNQTPSATATQAAFADTFEEDTMPTADQIAAAVWSYSIRNAFGDTVQAQQILCGGEKRTADVQQALATLTDQVAQLRAAGIDKDMITNAVGAALAAHV